MSITPLPRVASSSRRALSLTRPTAASTSPMGPAASTPTSSRTRRRRRRHLRGWSRSPQPLQGQWKASIEARTPIRLRNCWACRRTISSFRSRPQASGQRQVFGSRTRRRPWNRYDRSPVRMRLLVRAAPFRRRVGSWRQLMSPRLHRTDHPAKLRVNNRPAASTTNGLGTHAPRALMMAVSVRVAVTTARPRYPHRYHRYPHRYHLRPRCHPPRHLLLLHRRPPRGRSPWASVTAGTLAATSRGAPLRAASTRCRSADRPRRRPPIVRASPMLRSTRCPVIAHSTGARQPAPAAACCRSGQLSPRRARERPPPPDT